MKKVFGLLTLFVFSTINYFHWITCKFVRRLMSNTIWFHICRKVNWFKNKKVKKYTLWVNLDRQKMIRNRISTPTKFWERGVDHGHTSRSDLLFLMLILNKKDKTKQYANLIFRTMKNIIREWCKIRILTTLSLCFMRFLHLTFNICLIELMIWAGFLKFVSNGMLANIILATIFA